MAQSVTDAGPTFNVRHNHRNAGQYRFKNEASNTAHIYSPHSIPLSILKLRYVSWLRREKSDHIPSFGTTPKCSASLAMVLDSDVEERLCSALPDLWLKVRSCICIELPGRPNKWPMDLTPRSRLCFPRYFFQDFFCWSSEKRHYGGRNPNSFCFPKRMLYFSPSRSMVQNIHIGSFALQRGLERQSLEVSRDFIKGRHRFI
ncbi:hypothetical protein EDB87DRAFT_990541 [Lactarius vividus]|nr:hypothetical protein EDB87DRAFT_990541 [Lactarius vividus]